MTTPLPLLDDAELSGLDTTDEHAGFGSLTTELGPLPLKAMDVRGRVDGLLGQVKVCQSFVNTHDVPLEATYIFPLPDRAAVTSFRMEVAGRVVDGVLQERAKARQAYAEAISHGHRASIAEEERPGVFTLRVGNLMPGEQADLHLTLAGPLPCSDGEVTFRFPLVVAPRYIPGRPLAGASVGDGVAQDTDAVPDASRITPPVLLPGFPNPIRLAMALEIHDCGLNVRDIRSSLHAVAKEESAGVHHVALQPRERLNRDFIVRYRLGASSVQTALSLHPDPQGDGSEGTFALTVVPPESVSKKSKDRPRDVAFVLDRSGSMEGWKMVAARRALARMVDTLSDRDRFLVLAFDTNIEAVPGLPSGELVSATDQNRFRAVEFLAGVGARGGTEMAQPLMLAAQAIQHQDPERERLLVLVTDGQVGNEDQILRMLKPLCRKVRVFTLGIDTAVNEAFLHRLAGCGKNGGCELVESEARLDDVLDGIHRRIQSPLLTDLDIEPDGLEILRESLVPGRRPHLFAGAPALILGRYRGHAGGRITLRARTADGLPWDQNVSPQMRENPDIAAVWARGHVRDLEDQYVLSPQDALEQRIVTTSLQFHVLCRFTAYVAIDRAEVANEGGQVHRVVQPVEMPQGWQEPSSPVHGSAYASLASAAPPPAPVSASMAAIGPPCSRRRKEPTRLDDRFSWGASRSGVRDSTPDTSAPPPAGPAESSSILGAPEETYGFISPDRSVPIRERWLGFLKSLRRGSSKTGTSVPADLAGCRRLARELVARLAEARKAKHDECVAMLRSAWRDLVALYKGLRAHRAGVGAVESLAALLDEYTGIVAQDAPLPDGVQELLSRAEAVLSSIADGVEPPAHAPRSTGPFWK